MTRILHSTPFLLVGWLATCLPSPLQAGPEPAWPDAVYSNLTLLAVRSMPEEMADWKTFAGLLSVYANDPTAQTGGPAPEADSPAELERMGIPRASLFEPEGGTAGRPAEDPSVPSADAIMELRNRMSEAMLRGRWDSAVRWAAGMAHLVIHAHVPRLPPEIIEERPESESILARWRASPQAAERSSELPPVTNVQYVASAWRAVGSWSTSAENAGMALAQKTWMDGGQEPGETIQDTRLWELGREMFDAAALAAAGNVASFWYTAWVQSGKPSIGTQASYSGSEFEDVKISVNIAERQWPPLPIILVSAIALAAVVEVTRQWLRARRMRPR